MGSYERERRPVAVGNTRLSVANFHQVLKIPTALGLPPAAANLLSDIAGLAPSIPGFGTNLAGSVLSLGLAVGRAQCGDLLLGNNPVGAARRAAVKEMCADVKGTLRLQFPVEDLGFGYNHDDERGWTYGDVQSVHDGRRGRGYLRAAAPAQRARARCPGTTRVAPGHRPQYY